MALGSQPRWTVRPAAGAQADVDVGLRNYMLRIYNYMASGLALTGIVALVFAQSGLYASLARTPLIWLVMLAPLGLVMWLSYGIQRMQASTAQALYWIYAALMGVSLASVFLVFTGESIARVFFITAGTFAAMSFYGYTTQRDLSQFGSFLIMGLIGIVIASLVNVFIASSALQFAISVIGVIVFTGLGCLMVSRQGGSTVRMSEQEKARRAIGARTARSSLQQSAPENRVKKSRHQAQFSLRL